MGVSVCVCAFVRGKESWVDGESEKEGERELNREREIESETQ